MPEIQINGGRNSNTKRGADLYVVLDSGIPACRHCPEFLIGNFSQAGSFLKTIMISMFVD
ncbi:MAG: hypothetical protein SGI89_05850 [bacterium]|nr:hypothetical protein [bacterium]